MTGLAPVRSTLTSSDTSYDDTPQFTPAGTPIPEQREPIHDYDMAETKPESSSELNNGTVLAATQTDEKEQADKVNEVPPATKAKSRKMPKCKHNFKDKKDKKEKRKSRKKDKHDSSDDSSDDSSSSDSDSESDSDDSADSNSSSSSSEDESRKKRSKRSKKSRRGKKEKKLRKRDDSSDDESSSEEESEESESEDDRDRRSKRSKKRGKKRRRSSRDEEPPAEEESDDPVEKARVYLESLGVKAKNITIDIGRDDQEDEEDSDDDSRRSKRRRRSGKGDRKKRDPMKPAFFRGDELWDKENYQFELKPTKKSRTKTDKSDFCFTIKRHFDYDGKFDYTDVWIHGNPLKEALGKIMADCKSVSLAEEEPVLDPNMLFLYLEDMREYRKDLKAVVTTQKLKKKTRKALQVKMAQLKCMIKYLDKDYKSTKAALYPLLEQGQITFDLLWCLFRSETIVYTPTYGNESDPRAFKVDYCNKESSFTRGVWYDVIGKYFDYDGKDFGLGNHQADIDSFRGVRKISSLAVYPIQYHPKYDKLRGELIERGKKFVSLAGMQYKFLKGMAFMKRRGQIIKINVNGRIMGDPATFRRINPNYPISNVKREDPDLLADCGDDCSSDEEDNKPDACNCADCLASDPNAFAQRREDENEPKKRWKRVRDPKTKIYDYIQVAVDENGVEIRNPNNPTVVNSDLENLKAEKKDEEDDEDDIRIPGSQETFSEDELMIASPVILGFAFTEKMWVEMSVSGIQDITWNEGAFDSLVLPAAQKDIIKALVTAHSKEAKAENRAEAKGEVEGKKAASQQNIDDVIQGKGKGLVSVLHGTPGTGKTLTAEGIAELLKCPLYCVSAGELGTSPGALEAELTKILDVAHAWGAVLLLDEADVFLEARTAQDIHRNALVSIFLRLLEYFQGILFLTTNRVSSFDEAFQSRIHIALRYQELDYRARRKVWDMFIGRVKSLPGSKITGFGKDELDKLARKDHLNGRQIKNAVRSAQALAINEKVPLSMKHIENVLDVAESFDRDLKGGSGYADAMRSYT